MGMPNPNSDISDISQKWTVNLQNWIWDRIASTCILFDRHTTYDRIINLYHDRLSE